MEITIIGEKIAVKPFVVEKTEGGIILPPDSKENPFMGTIVGIGNVVPDYAKDLAIGDVVYWIPNAGSYFEVSPKNGYLVIRPSDVIGVKKNVVN